MVSDGKPEKDGSGDSPTSVLSDEVCSVFLGFQICFSLKSVKLFVLPFDFCSCKCVLLFHYLIWAFVCFTFFCL